MKVCTVASHKVETIIAFVPQGKIKNKKIIGFRPWSPVEIFGFDCSYLPGTETEKLQALLARGVVALASVKCLNLECNGRCLFRPV